MSNMIKKFKKGFTLLEMLVVVGIIAILVGLVSASLSTAQKKARDAKRFSDLKSVQNCLEQYYSLNSFKYSGAGLATGTLAGTISCGGGSSIVAPVDPVSDTGNVYRYVVRVAPVAGTNETFSITSALESAGTGITASVSNLQ